MTLTLLHTAQVHVDTFEALRARIAPDVTLTHVVRPDWLTRAQAGIDEVLRGEITQAIDAAPGAQLCTCTSIGPVAEAAGALRIDTAMMAEAARLARASGGPLMMVYCVNSTLTPSVALLDAALEAETTKTKVHTLNLAQFWPLFEAGEHAAFAAVIATATREAASDVPGLAAIVLAQASMAAAAELMQDMGVPVLTSPETALRALLARA